jgi:hypothetical protein
MPEKAAGKTLAPPVLRAVGAKAAEKKSPRGGSECCDCRLLQKVIRFLRAATNHRLLHTGRPPLQRHSPDDVERRLRRWLESELWH